jgi:response regulator RpfG family c-di-GMP phosphodiesterase
VAHELQLVALPAQHGHSSPGGKESQMRCTPKVLVVDDEDSVRSAVAGLLEGNAGAVWQCNSVQSALTCLAENQIDVVLCDMYMPEGHGLELIRKIRQQESDVAFIIMTGNPELSDLISALGLHASGFLAKPFVRAQLLETVEATYEELSKQRHLASRAKLLSSLVQTKSRRLREALSRLKITERSSLEALVGALDAREHETCAHSFRVRAYTAHLARQAGYPAAQIVELESAALLHDVGKLSVPDSILLKAGPLTAEEFERCKKHSVAGADILGSIPSLRGIAEIVRHHHERWDGTGYPDRLSRESIPLGARLFAVADTLDALISDRCYRPATSFVKATEEIRRCSGSQFDPAAVDAFLRIPQSEWLRLRGEAEREFVHGPGDRCAASLFVDLVPELRTEAI